MGVRSIWWKTTRDRWRNWFESWGKFVTCLDLRKPIAIESLFFFQQVTNLLQSKSQVSDNIRLVEIIAAQTENSCEISSRFFLCQRIAV